MVKQIIGDQNFSIETRRLHITPAKREEASHYLREFDLEVTKFLSAEPFNSIESVKEFIQVMDQARIEGHHLVCSIYDKEGNFIGSVEFYDLDKKQPRLSIWICRNEWHKGYAYEVLRGMINFFKSHVQLEGFIYEVDRRNDKGIGLCRKLHGRQIECREVKRENDSILYLCKYCISTNNE